MKQFLALIAFLFISFSINAQLKAITSSGDEVILNNDGTWKYAEGKTTNTDSPATKVDTSNLKFTKNPASSFLVKSSKVGFGVYINPKKWSFEKSKEDDASEFGFTLKAKDAYGMLITEKIEIPMGSLKAAALKNAQDVSSDMKVMKEEYRNVNGKLILLMQMNGTVGGIKITYFGYYFSSEKGTIQLLTYTASNLFNEYKADIEEFLNGFVEPG